MNILVTAYCLAAPFVLLLAWSLCAISARADGREW